MAEEASYKVVDSDSGNTVALYRSRDEAEDSFLRLLQRDPVAAESLVMIAMDKEGHPLRSFEAAGFTPGALSA